jgi:hypothetical protein
MDAVRIFPGRAAYTYMFKSFQTILEAHTSVFRREEQFCSKCFQILVLIPLPAGNRSCGGYAITKL